MRRARYSLGFEDTGYSCFSGGCQLGVCYSREADKAEWLKRATPVTQGDIARMTGGCTCPSTVSMAGYNHINQMIQAGVLRVTTPGSQMKELNKFSDDD